MNSINDKIQQIVNQYYDKNVSKFCRESGISTGTMSSILGTRKSTPTIETLEKISTAMALKGIRIDWLYAGAELENTSTKSIENALKIDVPDNVTKAPLISQYAYAGYLSGYADKEYIEQQPIYYAAQKFSGGNYVAFEIRGDSMDDDSKRSICNSNVVLGRELVHDYWKCKLHIPKVFIIVHKTKGILCKEIIGHDVEKSIITCHSFNPEFTDFDLELKDIIQLFYIKEIKRVL